MMTFCLTLIRVETIEMVAMQEWRHMTGICGDWGTHTIKKAEIGLTMGRMHQLGLLSSRPPASLGVTISLPWPAAGRCRPERRTSIAICLHYSDSTTSRSVTIWVWVWSEDQVWGDGEICRIPRNDSKSRPLLSSRQRYEAWGPKSEDGKIYWIAHENSNCHRAVTQLPLASYLQFHTRASFAPLGSNWMRNYTRPPICHGRLHFLCSN